MKITGEENNRFILRELGQRIKEIRIKRSLTQQELAQNAGVSFSTIARIENGTSVNMENYMRILRNLNLLQNFDLLVPEQQIAPEDILERTPRRQRASKRKSERSWKWGDEE